MGEESTFYLVTHGDEMRGGGTGASSPIPSIGAATTAIDQYRTVGIHQTNLPALGAAFTDVAAVAALSKIAEGGLSSIAELEQAEAACQALLLHEVVHVVAHAPKIDMGNGLFIYRRWDSGIRTPFGFELFNLAQSRDFLVAPELLKADGGNIYGSTSSNCPVIGMNISEMGNGFPYWSADVSTALDAAISQHGIPAYLTDKRLIRTRRGDGFHKRFYSSLKISWDKATGDIPPVVCTFSLPPLLAVVLNRMNNRADLLSTVRTLREELAPVRQELTELNAIVVSSTDMGEIQRRIQSIVQSFDAIIPEANMSSAQRFQRRIAVVQKLSRPIIKYMAGFLMKTGVPYEELMRHAGSAPDIVMESRAIVDRTVTAKTFSGMMKIESIQSLVKYHFSRAEIDAIESSKS